MRFTPASPASLVAFLIVVAAVLGAAAWGRFAVARREGASRGTAWRATGVFAGGAVAWLAVTSVPVALGTLAARPLPNVPIWFGAIAAIALAFGLSPAGGRLASLPLPALVGFQAFRLPLELVLHSWAEQGTIPVAMTWTGANFDIVSGLTALLCAPLAARSRAAAWVANLVGIALLANVARVAVLSSPVPFGWAVEPPLQLAFHLPYALIVSVCVAGALAGHVVLTRRLVATTAPTAATTP
jgi:hypothetical protein